MFWLFKPPRHHISRRIPPNALAAYYAVENFAETQLEKAGSAKENAIAYIVSVWACNSVMDGQFLLSDFDYRYIQNAGMNAAKALPNWAQNRAGEIIDALKEKGVIPG